MTAFTIIPAAEGWRVCRGHESGRLEYFPIIAWHVPEADLPPIPILAWGVGRPEPYALRDPEGSFYLPSEGWRVMRGDGREIARHLVAIEREAPQ